MEAHEQAGTTKMWERWIKSIISSCIGLPTVAERWAEVEDGGAHVILSGSGCTWKLNRYVRRWWG
jgi:hypothetical protein